MLRSKERCYTGDLSRFVHSEDLMDEHEMLSTSAAHGFGIFYGWSDTDSYSEISMFSWSNFTWVIFIFCALVAMDFADSFWTLFFGTY